MPPRVLIVYANPAVTATPVSPYGAERVAHAMRIAGCEVQLCAPWLMLDPVAALSRVLDAFAPTLVGFSVRNVDDALVVRSTEGEGDIDTTFYLPEIREAVRAVQARNLPILVGGPAVSSMASAVLEYLDVDHGVMGAADDLVWRLGRGLAEGLSLEEALPDDPRVVGRSGGLRTRGDAEAWRPVPGPTPRMPEYLRLARERGGRIPVQISAGCDRRCHFCVEASFHGYQVSPRPVEHVVHEIGLLAQAGIRRIWLAASELNVPTPKHALEVLRAIAEAGLDVDVTGFLQPAPATNELLDALEDVGVDPTTLSWELGHLDDALLRAGVGPANRHQIDALVDLYLSRGHRQLGGSVLFGAHPEESFESVDRALVAARQIDAALPDGLGLAYATGGRVYPAAPLGRWVREHLEEARPDLYGTLTDSFVAPLVFCRPVSPRELLRYVQEGLASCRGPMSPLNAETAATGAEVAAERLVNYGILVVDEAPQRAADCFRQALEQVPGHPEALRQLGLTLANRVGDLAGARAAFEQLAERVQGNAERSGEVAAALAALARLEAP